MSARKKYTVRYERDETGWWVATAKGVRGCHTQGRTIEEAERRIREALAVSGIERAATVPLERDVRLPASIKARIRSAQTVRKRAEQSQARARDVMRDVIGALQEELGLSVRDTGTLLGISGQRVHQLAEP